MFFYFKNEFLTLRIEVKNVCFVGEDIRPELTLGGFFGKLDKVTCSFVGLSQKIDLNDGNHSKNGTENDEHCRKSGDRIVRRFLPKGFWWFLAMCGGIGVIIGSSLSWLAIWFARKNCRDNN